MSENVSTLPFTEEELKELNFTKEELSILEDANAICDTIELWPENPDKFLHKLDKEFKNDKTPQEVIDHLTKLSKTDPDFLAEIVSIIDLVGDIDIENHKVNSDNSPKVEKISIDEINKIDEEDEKREYAELISAFLKMTPEERAEAIKNIQDGNI